MSNSPRPLSSIATDTWRADVDFSHDMKEANEQLWAPGISDTNAVAVLNKWLGESQPCLFGRIAARNNLMRYCILKEEDVAGPVDALHDKIQSARLTWTRDAFEGRAHGFIVLVASRTLAQARVSSLELDSPKSSAGEGTSGSPQRCTSSKAARQPSYPPGTVSPPRRSPAR